ncbi:GntR family transcriptional regulator [Solicola gregarius]|uniref:GntR family transcriptional regulator n=1 Tax=Solicola gregarius TaxID=2908642 RepID=A0AA46TI25_9ACTN|nr:GntR family transcriptional regulator [Solicola gregarius]UYM05650.1 GntR family transcriptional regulator [Solicola gregarius]
MAVRSRRPSYVSIAYDEIRTMILSGELAPGSRLTVRPLADRLDLSPTPIRTALATLERQGMLEGHEHRGYFVPTLGRDDMLDIYEVREAVDTIASRRAARAPDRDALVETLDGLLKEQRRFVRKGDIDSYAELDMRFHRTIWYGSGNHRLAAVCENLAGQLRIGNNISARAPGRPEASLDEHLEIVDAIRAGDSRAAASATRRHVRLASAALAELLG